MCLGEDIADEGPLNDTIDQETKAFDENVGALQADVGSAATTSEKRLATSAGALQADSHEAAIQEISVVSPDASFTCALQAGSYGVKADTLAPCATSSVAGSSVMPL